MNQDRQAEMIVDALHPSPELLANHDQHLGISEPTLEELERELPVVYDGQIPLGDLLSRVVQSVYAELLELVETLPNMSDSARKRTLADWVVKTKKQVVKLYAVAKWSRDAVTIQKCMNITAFLMTQNHQFEESIRGLNYAKESLDPARLRNHDLLTSLDVLTTGSYLRLPTIIKKMAIPSTPLTDAEVAQTLFDMEETIRYRLRLQEIIPVEMSRYHISDGRVHFNVPQLFNTSLCLRGGDKNDGWFFVHVEFLITVGGDLTGLQEFPRVPSGMIKRHITDEADARLAFYLDLQPDQATLSEIPPRPQLPQGVVDAPLVRIFNFLQMMSLSYQLEIMWYQAERMRSLGWADYLAIKMSPDRKTLTASYWIRPPVPQIPNRSRSKIPLFGGILTIAIIETRGPPQTGPGPARTSRQRAIARLKQKSKLGNARPSDDVEGLRFNVHWEPAKGALGINISLNDSTFPKGAVQVDPNNLDFEHMLRTVIQRHSTAILTSFSNQLQHGSNKVFSPPGVVSLILDGEIQALRVYLCADEVLIITIDTRTGRLSLRDTGDLASAGRGPRFAIFSDKLNENPSILMDALCRLRLSTILDLAEQKAKYLGLQCYRRRNIAPQGQMTKLGSEARGTLYIQLSNFPNHYLVLVVTDERFQYALITTSVITEAMFGSMILEDIAWLDFDRIHDKANILAVDSDSNRREGINRQMEDENSNSVAAFAKNQSNGFNLDIQGLRELYSYCSARVAYINVERQFKIRGIPFTHVNPTMGSPTTPELAQMQSSLARSVPALCVQSKHILSGAPAAEAAMPNIRVIPLNWWSNEKAQVVTCVKLKYVQQPMGKTASSSAVIRPSKRIIYDTTEAVVSFLSENVNTCVDEFLEEWARVSKMVVIAREVAQMAKHTKWRDVRLLSFDLQTVEFAYSRDYTVSISCQDQLSPSGGTFDLEFSRTLPRDGMDTDSEMDNFNPHEDAEPFLRDILRHAHGRLAPSLHCLVTMLRDTLSIVVVLEAIRQEAKKKGMILDVYPKAAGWYRLLYNDLKHALDFRLLSHQRVAILDASHSLFDVQMPGKSMAKDHLVLQPIPKIRDIVTDIVREGLASGDLTKGKVAAIDIGVICDDGGVNPLARAIHAQVLKYLK